MNISFIESIPQYPLTFYRIMGIIGVILPLVIIILIIRKIFKTKRISTKIKRV